MPAEIDELQALQVRYQIALALLTRIRNGPGVILPYELYADIQEFLHRP